MIMKNVKWELLTWMKNVDHYNWSETTYYQRNKDVILNKAKNYDKNDRERSRDNARDKYRNLSEEENNKKREYRRNRYHKMSEEKNKN